MEILKKIFKQTSWQVLGKVITSLSTFIIIGIVARNYKEAGTGNFTLALTYLAMFFLINDFGFNAHILRKSQVEWQELLGTRLIWAAALAIFSILIASLLPLTNFTALILSGILAIFGSATFISCNLIFQQRLRYDLSVLASSLGTIVYLLLAVYFSQNKQPVQFLIFAYSLGWIFIGLTSLLLVRKFVKSLKPIFDLNFIKKIVKESWPIAATLVLNVVYFRSDAFLIAFFKGQSDVGIYNVAYQVFQSVLVLPTFIMNAYYPLMIKSLRGIKLVGFSLLAISSLGSLVSLNFAPFLIKLLTGEGFLGASESLQILSLSFPAFFLSSLLMWFLISKGKYKTTLLLYTSGLGINLLLNFLFIPQYSFYAASWTTVISEYVILVMQIIVLRGILFR